MLRHHLFCCCFFFPVKNIHFYIITSVPIIRVSVRLAARIPSWTWTRRLWQGTGWGTRGRRTQRNSGPSNTPTHRNPGTVKTFLFVGHLISCILLVTWIWDPNKIFFLLVIFNIMWKPWYQVSTNISIFVKPRNLVPMKLNDFKEQCTCAVSSQSYLP